MECVTICPRNEFLWQKEESTWFSFWILGIEKNWERIKWIYGPSNMQVMNRNSKGCKSIFWFPQKENDTWIGQIFRGKGILPTTVFERTVEWIEEEGEREIDSRSQCGQKQLDVQNSLRRRRRILHEKRCRSKSKPWFPPGQFEPIYPYKYF